MPTPTIPAGNLYMNINLWSGTGATNIITNGVSGASFQPDFVWAKTRTNAYNHALFDSVRGANKALPSNATDAEVTQTQGLLSFNSNGFTLGTSSDSTVNNAGSGQTYVGWQWKAGGAAVSNTNGSITSSVSANTTSGFSVVTYTGTATAATVGHGLGAVPSMMIVKIRNSGGVYDWYVYHASLGNTSVLYLNLTNSVGTGSSLWNSTTPTSSVFSIGGAGQATNVSAGTFVAYCWAPIAGYSAFGSYVANGSADGPFIYTGFRPRFVIIKRSSNAGAPWTMIDTSRNPYNYANLELDANSSAAEFTAGTGMDIVSNGFKLRDATSFNSNAGDTFIYAAFAENPFKYANAR
jgi:hypothetical protein